MNMNRIELGDRIKCKFTGFKGIAFGRCIYLYGCEQILVKPEKISKEGKPIESVWIDEPQIELVVAKGRKRAAPRHGPATEISPNTK